MPLPPILGPLIILFSFLQRFMTRGPLILDCFLGCFAFPIHVGGSISTPILLHSNFYVYVPNASLLSWSECGKTLTNTWYISYFCISVGILRPGKNPGASCHIGRHDVYSTRLVVWTNLVGYYESILQMWMKHITLFRMLINSNKLQLGNFMKMTLTNGATATHMAACTRNIWLEPNWKINHFIIKFSVNGS